MTVTEVKKNVIRAVSKVNMSYRFPTSSDINQPALLQRVLATDVSRQQKQHRS